MTTEEITAEKLGISRTERKMRIVHVMPPGGFKTIRVKERSVSLAAIPALDRELPEVSASDATRPLPPAARAIKRGR